MLLAIDVGNTQTVIGVYRDGELVCSERLATNRTATSDEIRALLTLLFSADDVDADAFDSAILACVVPQLIPVWRLVVRRLCGLDLLLCNAETAGDLFPNKYARPQEIGADRVADAVAARLLFGAPVIVVDFGTATNIEVIDPDGAFVGGVIMPGLQTSADSLAHNGSLLPALTLGHPDNPIGGNTQEAILSGIVIGQVEAVDGLVRRICAQMEVDPKDVQVVATGGLARLAAPDCSTVTAVEENLTLTGLWAIAHAHKA